MVRLLAPCRAGPLVPQDLWDAGVGVTGGRLLVVGGPDRDAAQLAARPQEKPACVQELAWALVTSAEFRFNH